MLKTLKHSLAQPSMQLVLHNLKGLHMHYKLFIIQLIFYNRIFYSYAMQYHTILHSSGVTVQQYKYYAKQMSFFRCGKLVVFH